MWCSSYPRSSRSFAEGRILKIRPGCEIRERELQRNGILRNEELIKELARPRSLHEPRSYLVLFALDRREQQNPKHSNFTIRAVRRDVRASSRSLPVNLERLHFHGACPLAVCSTELAQVGEASDKLALPTPLKSEINQNKF